MLNYRLRSLFAFGKVEIGGAKVQNLRYKWALYSQLMQLYDL